MSVFPVPGSPVPERQPANRWLSTTIIGAVLATGAVFIVAGAVFLSKQTANTWAITYEVTVTGPTDDRLSSISYAAAPARGEDSADVSEAEVRTDPAAGPGVPASWTTEVQITAQKRAGITATAQPGSTASCRILLDASRELARQTGSPGGTVSCSVDTPAFPAK